MKGYIRQRIPEIEVVNTLLFFLPETFANFLKELGFDNCRQRLFGGEERCLVLHVDQIPDLIGPYMGVIQMTPQESITSKVRSFCEQEIEGTSHRKELLKRSTVIRNLKELVIPEQLLFSPAGDVSTSGVWDCLSPVLLGMIIVSISSEAHLENATWHVTIRGPRWLQAKLTLEEGRLSIESVEKTEVVDAKDASEVGIDLFRFYHWVYERGDLDKIALAKDVVSSVARDIFDVLKRSAEISRAARGNYQIYLQKLTDEFLDRRENLTDYVFEHHKELVGFQVSLASRVSTDSFRILGSSVLFGIGAFSDFLSEELNPVFIVTGLVLISSYVLLSLFFLRDVNLAFKASEKRHKRHLAFYRRYIADKDLESLTPGLGEVGEAFEKRYSIYSAALLSTAAVLLEFAILYILGI